MNEEVKRIPKTDLEAAVRRFRRAAAAAVVGAMAETDTSFAEMALRIGKREKTVRRWVMRLADGRPADSKDCLTRISDMATACGCRIQFSMEPLPPTPLTSG